MKKSIFFLFLFLVGFTLQSQAQNSPSDDDMYYWKILSKVKYKSNLDAVTGDIIYQPVFNKAIEGFEGKVIVLKGYIIPADLTGGKMTLSAFPYSSCFFCGGAGPESVVEIEASQPIIYRIDKPITLQGKLKLNRTDPLRLMYIMTDAGYYQAN